MKLKSKIIAVLKQLVLFRDGDKLYGRGSTDDKGPVLGWLHIIQVMGSKDTIKYTEHIA